MPSSNSEKVDTGLTKLGEMLAENGRKNKVHFLRRNSSIKKLSEGGFRGKSVHFNSIDANDGMTIEGDVVLLIDDVTTTGNSLYACREILFAYGADHVEMLALGKAI